MFFGKRMTDIVHELLEAYVQPGDAAIDATMGNGHDTLKLCELVGENGIVYGFDIQQAALMHTEALLNAHQMSDRAKLILDSHEHIGKYVTGPVRAFVFNLGYLPEGDHGVITGPESTVTAVEAALKLLVPNGLGLILAYYGHEGGVAEKEKLDLYLKGLRLKQYDVLKLENHNRNHTPPILYMVKKNG